MNPSRQDRKLRPRALVLAALWCALVSQVQAGVPTDIVSVKSREPRTPQNPRLHRMGLDSVPLDMKNPRMDTRKPQKPAANAGNSGIPGFDGTVTTDKWGNSRYYDKEGHYLGRSTTDRHRVTRFFDRSGKQVAKVTDDTPGKHKKPGPAAEMVGDPTRGPIFGKPTPSIVAPKIARRVQPPARSRLSGG